MGFLAKAYFNRLSFRQSNIESIINRFLNSRDEICEILAECAVYANSEDEEWLEHNRNLLSLAYYKFYDYMPYEIIQEFICLQACLKDPENRLYMAENHSLRRVRAIDLETFCKEISTFKNLAPAIFYNLHHGSIIEIRNHRIEYQARHALVEINKRFTEENLTFLNY